MGSTRSETKHSPRLRRNRHTQTQTDCYNPPPTLGLIIIIIIIIINKTQHKVLIEIFSLITCYINQVNSLEDLTEKVIAVETFAEEGSQTDNQTLPLVAVVTKIDYQVLYIWYRNTV